ncbi:Enoyl-[acyl-carrier-protein] reductase [Minicystis rosea]|nr:Enoyl-[acyl-carrier-protein] reductase [Minicystis rosea]
MTTWPVTRIQDLLGIELPILQAPMAGAGGADLAVAVAAAGGLGALPGAMLGPEQVRAQVASIRARTANAAKKTIPLNLNFFCHRASPIDAEHEARWRERLEAYYVELGVNPQGAPPASGRAPFDAAMCAVVEEVRPEVVSFHFGLPDAELIERVRAAGAKILSSATTVAEARWLEEKGCDAIIAQGAEAGGHRGMFLSDDTAAQVGTFALVPQMVDAVAVPVIAAGGIADARGIVAAFALGASAVQIGTAYLFTPEATLSAPHRAALRASRDDSTTLTNVFTGRPARGMANRLVREVGPMSPLAPAFPRASIAVAPLRAAAEAAGSVDFSPLWAGQAASLAPSLPAGELTKRLAAEALAKLGR